MIRKLSTALAAFVLALAPLVASAQITAGTELVGNLDQSLDSGSAQVGQRFTMHNVHSQDNNIHDAVIYGHVAQVQHAGQGTPGKIELAFDKLRTSTGASYALSARATNVQVNTKNNALKEVGGALAGMIVGNVLGKWVGTNIGGIIGAGGGYMYAKNNRQNVTVPQNAVVTMQVLRAYRQGTSR
jgi:hypothetical protein